MTTTTFQSMSPKGVPTLGDIAPNFSLKSIRGETIQLKNYAGKMRVILWFSRGFTCPYCRGFIDVVANGYDDLRQKNIEIIQISPNLRQSAIRFFDGSPPPYPMVFDPDKRLFANYGIGRKGVVSATGLMAKSVVESARRGELGTTLRATTLDVVDNRFLQRLHHHAFTATNQALIAIDIDGTIRHHHQIGVLEDLPSASSMIKFLEKGSEG